MHRQKLELLQNAAPRSVFMLNLPFTPQILKNIYDFLKYNVALLYLIFLIQNLFLCTGIFAYTTPIFLKLKYQRPEKK